MYFFCTVFFRALRVSESGIAVIAPASQEAAPTVRAKRPYSDMLHPFNKFPALYENRSFFTEFKITLHWLLTQARRIHTSYFLKIHFNIVLSSVPKYPKQPLSFLFLDQENMFILLLSHVCNPPWFYHSVSCVLFRKSDFKSTDLLDSQKNFDLESRLLSGVLCSFSGTFTATSVYEGCVFPLQPEHSLEQSNSFHIFRRIKKTLIRN